MNPLIEKDSPLVPLLILAFIGFVLLAGTLGLAYVGGVFTGKDAVMENDKRIMHQASQAIPP